MTLHKNVEVQISVVSLVIKIEIKRNDKSRRHQKHIQYNTKTKGKTMETQN